MPPRPLQPGDAFTGLEVGNISGAADAFSIGGFTLDPTLAAGGEGFDGVTPLATSAPLLEIGGSSLGDPADGGNDFAPRASMCTAAAGRLPPTSAPSPPARMSQTCWASPTLNSSSTGATAADGGSASDLPTVGSVYDAFNFGNGYENVYTAIPGVTLTASRRRTPSPTPW